MEYARLISGFSKVARYKTSIQKLIVFPYISYEQLNSFKNDYPLHWAVRNSSVLGNFLRLDH